MKQRPLILIINPNTSEAVTANIAALAEREAAGRAETVAITARFGAGYIGSRATVAIAGHAVIDAYCSWTSHHGLPEAVVVGCFGDPGLEALREIAPVPVVGFAEAAMLDASRQPGNFLVATSGAAWVRMLEELAHTLRIDGRVAAIVELDADNQDDAALGNILGREAERTSASRLILGGSGLIPRIASIRANLRVPLIDPHGFAVRKAIDLAMVAYGTSNSLRPQPRTTFRGISADLNAVLRGGRPAARSVRH